ncbi:hypothetical protein TcG_09668 [Trypanosoma cruzi]|nr:hypothetical protein TcG_09668 [Trypanosoma cruzi]
MSRGLPQRGQPCSVAFQQSFCLCFFDNPLWLYLPVNALLFFVTVGKNLTKITRYRHFSVFQQWGPYPCRGAGALVACRNSAAVRCREHDGDQDDFTPRECPTPCPVRGGEAVCLQTVGQNCTTVSLRSLR